MTPDYPAMGDRLADDCVTVLGPEVVAAAQCIEADDMLRHAMDVLAAVHEFARVTGRRLPISVVDDYLRRITERAARVLPDEPLHLGATVDSERWAS